MNELIIDEKKYISSKQAAKVTGYAKDYVGQLCREGRVQAQLVGRSWYVLESAIKDHRFGTETAVDDVKDLGTKQAETAAWSVPRYAAAHHEMLPTIHPEPRKEAAEAVEDYLHVQTSEVAWTDSNLAEDATAPTEWVDVSIDNDQTFEEAVELEAEQAAESGHSTLQASPDESLRPSIHEIEPAESLYNEEIVPPVNIPLKRIRRPRRALYTVIRVVLVVVAATFSTLAALNSGYLDSLITSSRPVSILSGYTVLEK